MDKETRDAFKAMGKLVTDGFKANQQEFTAIRKDMATNLEPINADIQDMKADIAKIKSDIHYIHNDTKTIPDLFNLIKEQDKDIEALKV